MSSLMRDHEVPAETTVTSERTAATGLTQDAGVDPPCGWRYDYARRVDALRAEYLQIPPDAPVRLAKKTSNLFRPRQPNESAGLDVSGFDGVLDVDPAARTAEVQGMTTYEHLVDATLPHGLAPLCVPQLKTITLGGAVTGLGIESASFRNGCPHESVLDMDVLTGDGRVVTARPDSGTEHHELFHGFPNSYGSLGYALRLRIELEPVGQYVHLRHVRFDSAPGLADAIEDITDARTYRGQRVDFMDGVVFGPGEQYLTLGEMVDEPPHGRPLAALASDYTGMEIYYQSLRQRPEDLLTIRDYFWRWDTDWFWCSRAFGVQNPLIRRAVPRTMRRSDTYWRLVALDRRAGLSRRVDALRRKGAREHVVQDIEVPVSNLGRFLEFFHREVGITPVWVCPLRQRDPGSHWPLYQLRPEETYVNVGFWSTVPLPIGVDPAAGRLNRRIEQAVTELEGRKSLYSTAYYRRDQFDRLYGADSYRSLKESYDPGHRLLDMYDKTVGRR